jgi:hypothetical protein
LIEEEAKVVLDSKLMHNQLHGLIPAIKSSEVQDCIEKQNYVERIK